MVSKENQRSVTSGKVKRQDALSNPSHAIELQKTGAIEAAEMRATDFEKSTVKPWNNVYALRKMLSEKNLPRCDKFQSTD